MACKCVWKRVKGSGDVIVALCAEHELSEKEIRERVRRVDKLFFRDYCKSDRDHPAVKRLGLLKEN